MIRRHVSAALLLRDGFTGQPFASGSAFVCRLNGLPIRPVFKPGGYLVLTDLEEGEHTLSITARGFHTETLALSIADTRPLERAVSMRPDSRYAYPPDTARLRLELGTPNAAGEQPGGAGEPADRDSTGEPADRDSTGEPADKDGAGQPGGFPAHEELWVGWTAPVQLRLAQSVKAGEDRPVRLYCSGIPALLPIPGRFLLLDENNPEVVRLWELRGESGRLGGPVSFSHARGTVLVPAMRFRTDTDGHTELAFPRGGTVSLFCRGCLKNVELGPGATELRWIPGKEEEPDGS